MLIPKDRAFRPVFLRLLCFKFSFVVPIEVSLSPLWGDSGEAAKGFSWEKLSKIFDF